MTDRKRELGAEADLLFKDIRDELSSLLDNTIENSEKVPTPTLWLDFGAGMFASIETLLIFAEHMERLGATGDALEMDDVHASIFKH
jgi:thymidine kinase